MLIFLGNRAAKDTIKVPTLDGEGRPQLHPETGQVISEDKSIRLDGSRVTTVNIPHGDDGGYTRTEILNAIASADGLWRRHSHEPPVFVYVPESKPLQDFLAEDLGAFSGVPDDWDGPTMTDALVEASAPVPGDPPVSELLPTDYPTPAAQAAGFEPQS